MNKQKIQKLEKRKKRGQGTSKNWRKKKKTREKEKQGTSDSEVENSEMGCETQYERENQKGPGETKGDTEKLREILFLVGENRCFLCFLVGAHQPKFAQKRKETKKTCHMLQTRVFKKPYIATPLLTKNWWFTTCIVVKEEQWCFFYVKPGKSKKNKTRKGVWKQKDRKPQKWARKDEKHT